MNPGRDPIQPNGKLKKRAVWRLREWMDRLGVGVFSFVNCVPWTGEVTPRDIDLEMLKSCVQGHDKVIALGNFASAALRRINTAHFKLPHPSPRNRLLNSKELEEVELERCRRYLGS